MSQLPIRCEPRNSWVSVVVVPPRLANSFEVTYDRHTFEINIQGGSGVITRITGKLVRLGEAEARIDVGAFEYEVFVPEFVRRQLQASLGDNISLKTIQYIEGNPQQGRLTPRLVGFLSEAELEFFELVCSVDGMGVKKTLRSSGHSVLWSH